MNFLEKLFRHKLKIVKPEPQASGTDSPVKSWLTEEIPPKTPIKSIRIQIFSAIDYQERIGLQFLKNKIKESQRFLFTEKKNVTFIHDQKQLQMLQSFLSQKVRILNPFWYLQFRFRFSIRILNSSFLFQLADSFQEKGWDSRWQVVCKSSQSLLEIN